MFCLRCSRSAQPRGAESEWNANLKVDIVELVAKLPPTLKNLYLMRRGASGTPARRTGLASWRSVGLGDTKVTGDIVELGEAPRPSRSWTSMARAGTPARRTGLGSALEVVLERTKVTGDIVELVAKLPPTLKELRLGNTGCFGDAGKADWARLPALKEVGLSRTKVTGSK